MIHIHTQNASAHHQSRTLCLSLTPSLRTVRVCKRVNKTLCNFCTISIFSRENSIESILWHWCEHTSTKRHFSIHKRQHQHSHSHFFGEESESERESGKNQFVFGHKRKCETIHDIVHDMCVCVRVSVCGSEKENVWKSILKIRRKVIHLTRTECCVHDLHGLNGHAILQHIVTQMVDTEFANSG